MLHGMSFEVDDAAWQVLQEYEWPGNVRELVNLVERLTILFSGRTVGVEDLQLHLSRCGTLPQHPPARDEPTSAAHAQIDACAAPRNLDLRAALAALEGELIEQAMAAANGVVVRAAELLHIPRTTLIAKLRRLRPNDRRSE
jgi:sigma-54 specific flagellar transcriptional regulator A